MTLPGFTAAIASITHTPSPVMLTYPGDRLTAPRNAVPVFQSGGTPV